MTKDILRTPNEWADALGIHILDPDGWRDNDYRSFLDPIAADEFDRRVWPCTIRTHTPGVLPKAVDLARLINGGAS